MQLKFGFQSAFTLVEIIMVVVIIGIMAVFAIPNYSKAVKKSYEKAGSNNLLIIYSAQKMSINNGQGAQTGTDTAAVNTALGLSIIGNGMDYSCTPTNVFTCQAARTDSSFTLRVTNASSTVCCVGSGCPSAPAC